MNSIIFGIASTSVQKIKNKNKQHLPVVILNKISDIQQVIYLMRKMEHTFACFLHVGAVLMVLTVNTIIGYPV
jgi:hypothetical protein